MADESEHQWDVMISYQWDSKEMSKKVKGWLEAKSLRVWFDEDEIKDSLYDAMSKGVEDSQIIILCITEAYQTSLNCSLEYKRSQDLHKPIIPLKFEKYHPSDALGLIIAGKVYYELLPGISDKIFNEKMEKVYGEIQGSLCPKSTQDTFSQEEERIHFGVAGVQSDGNVSHIMRTVTSLDLSATRKENELAFDKTDAVMGNKLPYSVAGMGEEKHANRSSDIDEKKKRIEEIKEMRIKDLPGSAKIGNSLNVDKKVMKLSKCYPCLNAEDLLYIVAAGTGGGNPAYVFMQTLCRARSQRTIKEFRESLKENKELFSNALKVLKNYGHQQVLYDITDKDLYDIALGLTVAPNSTLPDWKCVAEYFELNDYVDTCKNAIRQGNQYSQFDQLFQIIKTKIPSHTINEFIENLESHSLMDSVLVVNEQIEIKAKRDIKRNKK